MIASFLRVTNTLMVQLILVPAFLGGALAGIAHQNKRLLANLGGLWAQVIFGGLGVVVHELSHLAFALLFCHRIRKVALLRIPRGPGDAQLGYVQHSWQADSPYQRAGNLFIGIAPLIGGTAILLLLTRLLVPHLYYWWQTLLGATAPVSPAAAPSWAVVSWLLLVVNLSLGAFDLSPADLTNAAAGLVTVLIAFLIGSLVISLFWPVATVAAASKQLVVPIEGALGLALSVNLLLFAILRAILAGVR